MTAEFELSAAELELLRGALVALDRADEAGAVVAREGCTTTDRYGSAKAHPATDIEIRNRAVYARAVAQLGIKAVADDPPSPRSMKAQRAAQARWAGAGVTRNVGP